MQQIKAMKKNNAMLLLVISLIVIMIVLSCSKTLRDQHSPGTKNQTAFGFFQNEIKPVRHKSCFDGAYYRKLVSSVDVWRGISGRVVLPELHFDE